MQTMLSEFNIFGVFIAPIAVYAVVAVPIFMFIRFILWKIRFVNWVLHLSLFEVALYVCLVCLMVVYL